MTQTDAMNRGYSYRPYTLDDARNRLWDLIRATPNLDYLLLTKRPENVSRMMPHGKWPSVWLGTTIENEEYLWRADALLEAAEKVEVPVRFVSAEPLLGEPDFGYALSPQGINWLIVGGESGARGKVRPFRFTGASFLLRQAKAAGIPCFVKQIGVMAYDLQGRPVPAQVIGEGKGEEMTHWPAWLQVRQFPVTCSLVA